MIFVVVFSKVNRSRVMWVQTDVCRLFLGSVGHRHFW